MSLGLSYIVEELVPSADLGKADAEAIRSLIAQRLDDQPPFRCPWCSATTPSFNALLAHTGLCAEVRGHA
jgi:hypothetical protein